MKQKIPECLKQIDKEESIDSRYLMALWHIIKAKNSLIGTGSKFPQLYIQLIDSLIDEWIEATRKK